ncbi:hypothetical protein EVAR_67577_1 [Eumeta japonica]|uniref:Uncharacterized protein n=1 Tax=Eumeta variegata TaxID=151549 RepID=A0A4C2A4T6_EUMVA|nr:hypothetical protein EVAR_67577_1 [Eumeta japonica]
MRFELRTSKHTPEGEEIWIKLSLRFPLIRIKVYCRCRSRPRSTALRPSGPSSGYMWSTFHKIKVDIESVTSARGLWETISARSMHAPGTRYRATLCPAVLIFWVPRPSRRASSAAGTKRISRRAEIKRAGGSGGARASCEWTRVRESKQTSSRNASLQIKGVPRAAELFARAAELFYGASPFRRALTVNLSLGPHLSAASGRRALHDNCVMTGRWGGPGNCPLVRPPPRRALPPSRPLRRAASAARACVVRVNTRPGYACGRESGSKDVDGHGSLAMGTPSCTV